MRHPTDCTCLQVCSTAADDRARAIAREIRAMWDARAHGASLRQIAAATGSSHEHIRRMWAIRPEDEYPIHVGAKDTVTIDNIPSGTIAGLLKVLEVQDKFDSVQEHIDSDDTQSYSTIPQGGLTL